MMDIREYKGVIREAVRRERHCDANWSWKILKVNKDMAYIGWGYLKWLNGDDGECFTVSVGETEDFGTMVIGNVPNGHKVIWSVGPYVWNDSETVEGAISGVIRSMAAYARNTY